MADAVLYVAEEMRFLDAAYIFERELVATTLNQKRATNDW